MSGGGTNTVQSSQPNDIVSGHLGDLYNSSQLLSNAGGPNINTGQVSPLNGDQQQALQTMEQIGNGSSYGNLNGAQNQALNTALALGNGTSAGQQNLSSIMNGSTPATQALQAQGTATGTPGNAALTNILNGSNSGIQGLQAILNGSNAGVQGLQSIINGTNAGTSYLQSTLNPSYTNVAANPNLQAAMNAANYNTTQQYSNVTMPAMASQFASAGRFGSGAQAADTNQANNTLATQIANTNSGLANSDYMTMLGQQSANAGTLGGLQSGASQALGTLQGNAGQSIASDQAGAAGSLNNSMYSANDALGNLQMQAGGALTNSMLSGNTALQSAAMQGANNAQLQYGAASTQQQQSQAQLNALIAQSNQQANQPYTNMGWLSQILGGTAGIGGQNASSTSSSANPYSTALGTGLLGNSLYSSGALSGLMGGTAAGAGTAGAFGTPLFTAAIGSGAADTGGMSALMGLGGFMADAAPMAAAA